MTQATPATDTAAAPATALCSAPVAARAPAPSLLGPMNPPIATYAGQRMWVIGASYGIGAAIARELLARGAKVALSARKRELLAQVAGDSPAALIAPLDVTDHASVLAARNAVVRTWGGIDLALIVAGTHIEMRGDEFDLAKARQLLDVNLNGVLHCVDAIVPTLLAQRAGGIAVVASVAGYIGLPKALVYGASKAALINFTESLYNDLRPKGLGVYLVNPGFVDTPLTQKNDFEMPALMKAEDAARVTLDEISAGRFEIHYPKRFTRMLKLLRVLPYRLQLWLVRRSTGL
ncbi:MAG: SDR family NAD(P)-dependent oxidoreductase [Betaproteobacteria bacterium]